MGVKHPIAGIDDLEFLNPRIAGEWDATKNQDLDISQYVAGSKDCLVEVCVVRA